jgi:transcriptional regulator GlxA family with amidase domain
MPSRGTWHSPSRPLTRRCSGRWSRRRSTTGCWSLRSAACSAVSFRHDSDASAIARAIGHIRADIHSPIAVPDLARQVGMSASTFHKHFKTITSTTPLQYQKELRLLEARRLLKTGSASVTTVAYEVGYESTSQFSREYARKFGVPPSHDTEAGGLVEGSDLGMG